MCEGLYLVSPESSSFEESHMTVRTLLQGNLDRPRYPWYSKGSL
jgi:hypothetical protein